MIRIRDGNDLFELAILERGATLQDAEDACLEVHVLVSDLDSRFEARTRVWVAGDSLARFLGELRVLEEVRRGTATLESMSPDELELEVRTVDRAGHVVVAGRIGRRFLSASGDNRWSSVAFELGLDPTLLPRLVADVAAVLAQSAR